MYEHHIFIMNNKPSERHGCITPKPVDDEDYRLREHREGVDYREIRFMDRVLRLVGINYGRTHHLYSNYECIEWRALKEHIARAHPERMAFNFAARAVAAGAIWAVATVFSLSAERKNNVNERLDELNGIIAQNCTQKAFTDNARGFQNICIEKLQALAGELGRSGRYTDDVVGFRLKLSPKTKRYIKDDKIFFEQASSQTMRLLEKVFGGVDNRLKALSVNGNCIFQQREVDFYLRSIDVMNGRDGKAVNTGQFEVVVSDPNRTAVHRFSYDGLTDMVTQSIDYREGVLNFRYSGRNVGGLIEIPDSSNSVICDVRSMTACAVVDAVHSVLADLTGDEMQRLRDVTSRAARSHSIYDNVSAAFEFRR